MSSTQRALQIDELLRHILGSLDATKDCITLLATARVNKQWSSVALECIWANVSTRNIKRFFWSRFTEDFCPQRQSVDRFTAQYAPLIQSLTLTFSDSSHDWELYYSWLTDSFCASLTRLRVLNISVDGSRFASCMARRLITPNVTFLKLTLRGPVVTGSYLHEVFKRTSAVATHLRGISIACSSSAVWRSAKAETLPWITSIRSLTEVHLPASSLSPVAISTLTSLPNLRGVGASRYSGSNEERNPAHHRLPHYMGPLLPDDEELTELMVIKPSTPVSLVHLCICGTPKSISSALRRLDLARLKRLDIALAACDDESEVRALCSTISQSCPTLSCVHISAPVLSPFEPDLPRLSWSTLQPLAALRALWSVQLEWDTPLRICNADVEELAAAWPALYELRLCATKRPVGALCEAAGLDLGALAILARGCPRLLALDLEVHPVVPAGLSTATLPRFNDLQDLALSLGLPLPEPAQLAHAAAFLATIGPRDAVRVREPVFLGVLQSAVDDEPFDAQVLFERYRAWLTISRTLLNVGRDLQREVRKHDAAKAR